MPTHTSFPLRTAVRPSAFRRLPGHHHAALTGGGAHGCRTDTQQHPGRDASLETGGVRRLRGSHRWRARWWRPCGCRTDACFPPGARRLPSDSAASGAFTAVTTSGNEFLVCCVDVGRTPSRVGASVTPRGRQCGVRRSRRAPRSDRCWRPSALDGRLTSLRARDAYRKIDVVQRRRASTPVERSLVGVGGASPLHGDLL